MPGIGVSIGVDSLIAALENEYKNTNKKTKKILVTTTDNKARDYSLTIVKILRSNNVQCEFFLKDQKLSQQFRFASKNHFDLVITVGEEEVSNKTFNLKNLHNSDEQKEISLTELISKIESAITYLG